jgi:hypothetical protein
VDEAKCAPVYDSSSNVIPYNSIKIDNTGVKVGNAPKRRIYIGYDHYK